MKQYREIHNEIKTKYESLGIYNEEYKSAVDNQATEEYMEQLIPILDELRTIEGVQDAIAVCNAIKQQHRVHQATIIRLFMNVIYEYADAEFDLRNANVVEDAKKIKAVL